MSETRAVRFNEQPSISRPTFGQLDCLTLSNNKTLPEKLDDALYSPYDVFTAASLGDFAFVEEQLKSGFYPNRLNSLRWSALMYAAYLGHGSVCSLLLNYRASIDTANIAGQTALMLATACGNLPIVQLLASKGAKIDQQDSAGETALSIAVACSHRNLIGFLLESGANPNIRNVSGMTSTLIACTLGHEDILLTLLQHGGNASVKNEKGEDGEALASDNPNILAILRDPPLPKKQTICERNDVFSLDVLFRHLNLEKKYLALFKEKGIDLKRFVELSEKDLSEFGVKAFGPKKKMLNAIERYQTDKNFNFILHSDLRDANPGSRNQTYSDKILEEISRVQKELSIKDNELRKAKIHLQAHHKIFIAAKEITEESRKIAIALLEELKNQREHTTSVVLNVRLMETKLRELLTKFMEDPCD